MDFNQWDQRIGKRQQVRSVPIAWTKDPERPSGFAAESHPDGRIVEVSVSGAGIVATADDTIEIGDKMHLQCLGAIGPVLVRRIERNMYPGQHYYGIEYAEPNSALTRGIYAGLLAKETDAPTVYLPQG